MKIRLNFSFCLYTAPVLVSALRKPAEEQRQSVRQRVALLVDWRSGPGQPTLQSLHLATIAFLGRALQAG